MNCKPNQLAMIVRCGKGDEWSLGAVIQVTNIFAASHTENPCWEFLPEGRLTPKGLSVSRIGCLCPLAMPHLG